MSRASAPRTRRQRRSIAAGAVVLAAYALFSARAARAEFPLPLPHEIHREVLSHVHDVLRTIGRIPELILRENVRDLEVFLGGSEYYGPHHHNHLIYNFPVWIDGRFSYRPYTYCNDHLYGSYDYRPQFWAGWGDESQARWCDDLQGYYPYGYGCFQQYGDWRSTPGYSRGFDSRRYDSRHYDSRRYSQDRFWQGRRGWRDDGRHDSRSWDQSQRYDNRRPGEWRGQQRYDDRRPSEWRGQQRYDDRRPSEWRGQQRFDDRRPSEWRQPQGQEHRRPELRSERSERNQPKRVNPREVPLDRKRQHDSKSDSRHDSRRSNDSHPSWRDHN